MELAYRDKRRKMLRLLSKALEQNPNLQMQYKFGDDETGLDIYNPPLDIPEALNITGAEANVLLNELGDDGCLMLDYGSHGRSATIGLVTVRITGKGCAEMNRAIPASQEELWAIKQRLQDHDLDVALNI